MESKWKSCFKIFKNIYINLYLKFIKTLPIANPINIAIIILAAGSSSRLGSPKQLLVLNDKNLLQHTIDICLESMANLVTLVLGANVELIYPHLDLNNVNVTVNDNWHDGLSSSIICGLKKAIEVNSDIDAVLLVLCDQPFLTTSILDAIVAEHVAKKNTIVNCNYGSNIGPPTLFHKSLFPHLIKLTNIDGAKSIVKQFPNDVGHVDFPLGAIDIDTMDDYNKWLKL